MKKYMLLLVIIVSCGRTEKISEINLSYVKSPLNIPLIVAYEKGIYAEAFKKQGFTLHWHEINSGAQQTEAIAARSIDIAPVLGGTSAILAAANGVDLKIVDIFARAPKAFAIMVKEPSIKTPSDLKGKKVGGPKGSELHQLLAATLLKVQLNLDDVTLLSMKIPETLTALSAGTIDAGLLPINVRKSAQSFGARILVDGENLIQGITVTAVRGEFAQKHPKIVQIFRNAHQEAITYMKNNPEESIQLTANALKISTNEVQDLLVDYNFDPQLSSQDREDIKATQKFLSDIKLIEKEIDIDLIII
ncbi:MAG: ABC transporter substrate-binding protein [Brevinema sp.]